MADPDYIVDGVLTDSEAWVGIAHESLSLPASTVTWTTTADGQVGDFSQYMDFKIICYCAGSTANDAQNLYMKFNNHGVTGGYEYQQMIATVAGTVTATTSAANKMDIGVMPAADGLANAFGAFVISIHDVNSGKYKTNFSHFAHEVNNDGSTGSTGFTGYTWRKQDPITEIDIFANADNLIAGSTFSLFGILPRMGPPSVTVSP